MNFRAATVFLVVAGLLAAGLSIGWIVRPLAAQAAWHGAGESVAGGMLGGLRTLAADLVWLRAYATWERRDVPATESLLELATALDSRPLYFWLNGARMMAYDLPVWRIEAASDRTVASPDLSRRIERDQARRALAFLAKARATHPSSSALWIEQANIELNRLHDVAAAALSYRRAAEQPDAPYYAARIHAELLRRLGRNWEALDWLRRLYPTLPRGDEAAAAEVVRARIRDLEREIARETSRR